MMSFSAARFAISLLPLFAAAARAVSLSDFTPRVDGLSDKCSTVYNREIKDCTADDLQTGENCSVACISGLLTIASQVKSYCADDDVAETSIIGVFLLGKGPETLCSNIAATTIGSGGHTSTTSTSHSTTEKTTSTRETSTEATTTMEPGTTIIAGTSTTAEASTTAAMSTTSTTASSTDDTSTSAAETTTAAAATTTTADSSSESSEAATSTSSAAASTSSGATDLESLNDGSGGGSPFDLALGNASPRACLSGAAMGAWALLLVLFFS
ncbi:hypothetical protein BFW01_g1046 [Lasiodiplodia theobromae]|uniref:Uncharacterized protein n=1 Tax=Lasiodiplodia theobromae TaxID=45133 RepID=A0A5N5D7T8_9PEZI|nr:uncharacterized protein LTHEOB_4342 [Lasiodiplodia theobromae]KAB2573819.1 hypothetical protein DBV05_g7495 [Lasiodiplodia theobromae]KAF4546345.1 hypothetical protein LTHEOB_4342 [Lasiodiplodia theobromae]KAF9630484.1 hypothetical protein BFW01_g1046 [Lasiodiplodia theobromae]